MKNYPRELNWDDLHRLYATTCLKVDIFSGQSAFENLKMISHTVYWDAEKD